MNFIYMSTIQKKLHFSFLKREAESRLHLEVLRSFKWGNQTLGTAVGNCPRNQFIQTNLIKYKIHFVHAPDYVNKMVTLQSLYFKRSVFLYYGLSIRFLNKLYLLLDLF